MFRFIRRYLGRLKGNARVCICFHPLWGIPFTFYYYYLSMYLKEMGVSDTGLGQIMLAGTAASFVFSIVSAPLFLVFVFLRKYIMSGVSRSGIKG